MARKKQKKQLLCRVPSANHEDAFIGATIDAVKQLSGTGRLRQVVVEKGGEARTINLCQQCYNE